MSEKMRGEFEAQVRKDKSFHWRWLDRIDGDPDYCAGDIQRLWEFWQAALSQASSGTSQAYINGIAEGASRAEKLAKTAAEAIETAAIMKCAEVIWKHLAEVKSRGAVFGGGGNAVESLEMARERILALIPQDGRKS